MRTTTAMVATLALAACADRKAEVAVAEQAVMAGGAVAPMSPAPAAAPPEPGAMQGEAAAGGPARRVADPKKAGQAMDRLVQEKIEKEAEPEQPTRSWFPETFLFEPLVVTDDGGKAVVAVRVPDRLTTWRVLALAHSRTGAQGGAVTSFLGTLPTYVDPVVPPFLVQGDTVRIPIQLINTTASDVTSSLEVTAERAQIISAPRGARNVPAQGSALDHATLVADRIGPVKLRVALAGSDAIERSFEVRPAGRLVSETRSGTLAAARRFTVTGPAAADPATDRVRLLVFPGPLALLRSELTVSVGRGSAADDAYALLLAGKAPALLAALGDKPDPVALRELAIVAGQRAIRSGRTLDIERATLVVEPALAHPDNPVLARLGERAAAHLAQHQRPDGTFSGQTGWTLQRVLVATADAVRASQAAQATTAQRQRGLGVATRAAAAFARTAGQVTDGYTAAAILATRAITGELAETLRARVRGAIKSSADGAGYLEIAEGVVRADGTTPTRIEATALAVLALDGDARAPLADFGTTLLGAYSPVRGWGDGRVNLVAMQAVLALFKSPLPSTVTITLTMDGAPIVRGTLDSARLRDVLALDGAAPLAGEHRFELTADPPVPGLGYALSLDSWLPWDQPPPGRGLEHQIMALAIPARVEATAGKPVELALTAVAPRGIPLHIEHALPAGVQVDAPSLEAHVASGAITRFVAVDGRVDLHVPALKPGQTFQLTYRAIPTLGGSLRSGASRIAVGTSEVHIPPSRWTIK